MTNLTHISVSGFVVGSFLAPRGFSPATPVFLSPQKPCNTPNCNSTWNVLNDLVVNKLHFLTTSTPAGSTAPVTGRGSVCGAVLWETFLYKSPAQEMCHTRAAASHVFKKQRGPGFKFQKNVWEAVRHDRQSSILFLNKGIFGAGSREFIRYFGQGAIFGEIVLFCGNMVRSYMFL